MKLEVEADHKLYPYGTDNQVIVQYIDQVKTLISMDQMYIELHADSQLKLDQAKNIMRVLID